MTRLLLAILLAASLPSIAQSAAGKAPGAPAGNSAPLCLTPTQRQRLADSLATLPVVRQAAYQFRLSADAYAGALVAQQRLTTDAHAQADNWKGKARRRGLLNFLLLAVVGGVTYISL